MKKTLLAAVVLGTLTVPAFAQTNAQSKSRNLSPQHQEAFEKLQASLPPPNFTKSAAKSQNSIVRVITNNGDIGSGFAIANGRILVTASHVVRDAKSLSVQLSDGKTVLTEVLVDLPHRDLVALRVLDPLPPLPLATEEQFTWKTPVMVMGHGLGVHQLKSMGELTYLAKWSELQSGVRSSPLSGDTLTLETSAISHPGHSGSPVLTPDGLVVGVMSNINPLQSKVNRAIHVIHIEELLAEVIRAAVDKDSLEEVSLQLNEDAESLDDAITELLDAQLTEGELSDTERLRLVKTKRFFDRIQSLEKRRQALAVMRSKHGQRSRVYARGGGPNIAESAAASMSQFYFGYMRSGFFLY